jgi:hypothetical protein
MFILGLERIVVNVLDVAEREEVAGIFQGLRVGKS